MSKNSDGDGCFVVIMFLLWGAVCIYASAAFQRQATDNWWQDELARRGHAHYYLDANNERQWNWKDEPQ